MIDAAPTRAHQHQVHGQDRSPESPQAQLHIIGLAPLGRLGPGWHPRGASWECWSGRAADAALPHVHQRLDPTTSSPRCHRIRWAASFKLLNWCIRVVFCDRRQQQYRRLALAQPPSPRASLPHVYIHMYICWICWRALEKWETPFSYSYEEETRSTNGARASGRADCRRRGQGAAAGAAAGRRPAPPPRHARRPRCSPPVCAVVCK